MTVQLGSPPRMRGKRKQLRPVSVGGGITPADAGKTFFAGKHPLLQLDHPRGCGENVQRHRSSSPRQGITPADAGKTTVTALKAEREQDHPRGCGENNGRLPNIYALNGSPPRMRGKPRCGKKYPDIDGITPADAGKTAVLVFLQYPLQDHPRGCGEN